MNLSHLCTCVLVSSLLAAPSMAANPVKAVDAFNDFRKAAQTTRMTTRAIPLAKRSRDTFRTVEKKPFSTVPKSVSGNGLGSNPFKGKSPAQINNAFKGKGFEPRGPNPISGKGGYVNPKTTRSYHIDPGGNYKKGKELPHVDVNRVNNNTLQKKKYPIGDKLND